MGPKAEEEADKKSQKEDPAKLKKRGMTRKYRDANGRTRVCLA